MTKETNIPKWKRAGFDSEAEYDAHMDAKMASMTKQLKELEKELSKFSKQSKGEKESKDE